MFGYGFSCAILDMVESHGTEHYAAVPSCDHDGAFDVEIGEDRGEGFSSVLFAVVGVGGGVEGLLGELQRALGTWYS